MTLAATFDLDAFVRATLAEDLGSGGDVTSNAVIPAHATLTAVMASRDDIVVAGMQIAAVFFGVLDPSVEIERFATDGTRVAAGTVLLRIAGNARALLAAERSALNTVQHLSGIATLTRAYVDAVAGTGAVLLDTRKTLPGLRAIEKYAVRCGGGTNHRLRLDDGVLIKDNHVAIAGGVDIAVRAAVAAGHGVAAARAGDGPADKRLPIVVEVDRIDQIEPALAAGADRLLLDNMAVPTLRTAVAVVAGRVPTEASGGVRLDTIRAIAETGVTFISVGRLTQSAPAADIGLDYV